MKEELGVLAVVLGIGAAVPYILGILKGSTKPHRVSWAIWAMLGLITLTSYVETGAKWSALLAVAAAFNNMLIFLLSFKYGTGGSSGIDKLSLAIGLFGVVLWVITREAAYALLFAIFADAIGTILSVHKAYLSPWSESAVAWSMSATASLCGLLAVHAVTPLQVIYPAYALIGGTSLALVTILRRRIVQPIRISVPADTPPL